MKIDFLIIGQGLAGTALGYRLKKAGKIIKIIDLAGENNSSRIAAGLYNPVTGRKMVKTWNADLLFPEISPFYRELEQVTHQEFLLETPIYRPFVTIEEQNEWMGNSSDPGFEQYLAAIFTHSQSESIHDPYGGVMLRQCGWLDIAPLLDAMKGYFGEDLIVAEFDENLLSQGDSNWIYDDLQIGALIFCNGLGAMKSSFFGKLPFAPVKGEILEVKQNYCPDFILNRGVFRVHLGNQIHRVGSTYTKHDLEIGPSESAKSEILNKLNDLVKIKPEEIVTHKTGIRPATRDRKPFLGKHPYKESVYIFNGFGAKGVSLIPFFSKMMTQYLIDRSPLSKDVDIARYFTYI